MNQVELNSALELHRLYLALAATGVRLNLQGTNLYSADLRSADLRSTDLRSANLEGANLSYPIYQASLGQYNIHTNKEYIRIGCKYLTVQEWLGTSEAVAVCMGLNKESYKDYMAFIKWYSTKPISKGDK